MSPMLFGLTLSNVSLNKERNPNEKKCVSFVPVDMLHSHNFIINLELSAISKRIAVAVGFK